MNHHNQPCPMCTHTTTPIGKALMASNLTPRPARTTQTGCPTKTTNSISQWCIHLTCHTGTCAWVIWSTTQLWSGKGIVPSTTDNLYSGLAEAYGIYTVLWFFQTYICSFLIVLPHSLTLKQKLQQPRHYWLTPTIFTPLYTCNMTQDDYPIFHKIQMVCHTLQLINVQLLHVTAYQDANKLKQPLTTGTPQCWLQWMNL